MKRINKIFYIIIPLMLVFYTGCNEEGRIDHIDDSAPAPAQVSDVTVRNTHGGAVLKYKLPNDNNLLYVKAIYEIQPGVIREAKSSYFKDSIVLEGFGSTKTYDVQIFSVGKNEKMSAPLTEKVNPLTPPVHMSSIQLREIFGGVAIDIENPYNANLAIVLMADTENVGYLSELITFFTSAQKGSFNYRGLDSIPTDYGVYLRDRWNNLSETITAKLKPWFEEVIPKATWQAYNLPGDASVFSTYYLHRLWDNNPSTEYISGEAVIPSTITWDLGMTVKLSRLKLWPRQHEDDRWKRSHPKVFEIYGSISPSSDGSLDNSWIPLGRFECVKPSGTGPTITQEDIDFANAGIDFDFEPTDFAPDPYTTIRYIRLITTSTFANTSTSNVMIGEISFWGTIVK